MGSRQSSSRWSRTEIEPVDHSEMSPLVREIHLAAITNDPARLELAILHGADVNQPWEDANFGLAKQGLTALTQAIALNYVHIVQMLLEAGADVTLLDESGSSYLHKAAVLGRAEVITLLVHAGADLTCCDSQGNTPLHCVCKHGFVHNNVRAVRALLQLGSDPNVRNNDGMTPLHYASIWGLTLFVNMLLQYGAELDAVDSLLRTSFYHSILCIVKPASPSFAISVMHFRRQFACVKLLLKYGCDALGFSQWLRSNGTIFELRAPSESRRSRWLIGQRRRDGALVEMEKKTPKKEKTNLQEFEGSVKDIRVQFGEQLKCLDGRTESHSALMAELQDFCRRRAEIELEYSKSLEKLHRQIAAKHKAEKQKRESWTNFAAYSMWKMFVEETKIESRNRSVMADLLTNHVAVKVAFLTDQMQRITKRGSSIPSYLRVGLKKFRFFQCREIGTLCHGEILRVLSELHTAIKTYQLCHGACSNAELKFKLAETQKSRFEDSWPKKIGCRKHRFLEKAFERRQAKYNEYRLKALKARNEYLLCVESANAALHKYFAEDLSDIIDCMDIGLESSLRHIVHIMADTRQVLIGAEQRSVDAYREWSLKLDARADKQRFLESNHSLFVLPRRFEFRPQNGDDVKQVSAPRAVQDELLQRYWQLHQRLVQLKTESEEVWKTLETTERAIIGIQQQPKVNVCERFSIANCHGQRQSSCREAEANQQKRRQDIGEFEDFYLNVMHYSNLLHRQPLTKCYALLQKFQQFLLTGNLISRLDARFATIKSALGVLPYVDSVSSSRGRSPSDLSSDKSSSVCNIIDSQSEGALIVAYNDHPSLVNRLSKPRRRRIGAATSNPEKRIKLFGGSLEEYVEMSDQEIPLIIRSCIRMLSLFGLHHQGVFRVSGSQLEINAFKEAFERGEDPLADVTDASDVNSVAGVLKLYFRELREPLFPLYMFDQFVECACFETKEEFVIKVRELVAKLPRPIFVVMRYLFAFLSHLSEFSDENMMDPYNLAICFGPTLLPIPESKDQVFYHNHVNELMRNLILFHEEVFPNDGGIVYEKYLLADQDDAADEDEDMAIGEDEDMMASVDMVGCSTAEQRKLSFDGDAACKCRLNGHVSQNDLTMKAVEPTWPNEPTVRAISNADRVTDFQSLLASELSGYNSTVMPVLQSKGRNQELRVASPDRPTGIYSQPFKVNSPITVDSDTGSPVDHPSFNWGAEDGHESPTHADSCNAYSYPSKQRCNKNAFKRLSLSSYTYVPYGGDVVASRKGNVSSPSSAVSVEHTKALSPQSLREIQSELKAVLTSLETFTIHQQRGRYPSSSHLESCCDAAGTEVELLTPDLVKNLPDTAEKEEVVAVNSVTDERDGDRCYVSSLTVDTSSFAERFAQSRESTIRKMTSPSGQQHHHPELLPFPYIDQTGCCSPETNGADSSPRGRSTPNKPPVPKKPSNCSTPSS
ncbi:hypothetical protein M514_06577 [Trichuris suis]|uniref:Rho-GAP domain-containing protein n=1 Tax=Trichuris suis TaxID=68888 RepID=A0A085N6V3_9BILA|nr:hypothetical protein M514_06577 [Trichuris suis]